MIRICIWATALIVLFPTLSNAQFHLLDFNSRGSYFTTAPSIWLAQNAGIHGVAANSSMTKGTSAYKHYPKPTLTMTNIAVSGNYIRHSIMFGYEIFAGAGRRAYDRTSGASLSSQTIGAGIVGQLGLRLMQAGGLSIIPYGGFGYGIFGERLKLDGTAEKAGQTEYEFDDVYVNNNSMIVDYGVKALFRFGHRKGQNKSRLTMGGQVGYRNMLASGNWMGNYERLPEKAPALGTKGLFTGVVIGMGLSD